jgi:beta-lactamase regulating signal transducer with metallopeptidase domain
MIDVGVLQTLVVGHLWQSVAIAAVLAVALILGKRLRGTTRYGLAATAFVVSLALPLAAFIPGETLVTTVLDKLAPPAQLAEPGTAPETAAPAEDNQPFLRKVLLNNGVGAGALDAAGRALDDMTKQGTVPASQTDWGKTAVAEGAPAWALDMGVNAVRRAIVPPPSVEPAPTTPLVTLQKFMLPDWDLPDLTIPRVLVWIAGALFLLVRTGRDLLAVERLVARAKPIELPQALKQRMGGVRVATSADAPGPMAAGLFRPCVVLPENIALSSPGVAGLLEHERAHIERRDMAVALLQRLTLALLWWSPAMHWISRRIDEEREVVCDEAAVARTGDAKAFARSLTKQAENQLWARAPKLAVGAIGPRSQVGRRIRRLIDLAKGVSPAKYSGRLAFAGLALAVAIAAMVTPRVPADAQQSPDAPPPVDQSLSGQPIDSLTPEQARDALRNQRADRDDDLTLDGGDDDFASLGEEIGKLMESVGAELEFAFAGLSPELEAELEGLSTEMAALGVEISAAVSQEVLEQMPEIMAQVREALEAQGIDVDDLDGFSEADREQLRQDLQEARDELKEALGPEMKEEIRRAIEEARQEVAEHRDEIAAAVAESRAGMTIARDAMAKVRAELEAARLRGDFNPEKYKYDFDFNFDKEAIEKLKNIKIDPEKIQAIRIRGEELGKSGRLMGAAARCDEDRVRELIAKEKADVNARMPGDGTALIAAARRGCEDAVRVLLDAGADPNGASVGDGNPLIQAALQGHEDVTRLLVDRGANVNAYVEGDETPLISAARKGDLEIVKLLVERGANVNLAYRVRDWAGAPQAQALDGAPGMVLRSPLNMAERYHHDDVAAYLRSRGAVASPKPAN